MTLVGSVAKFSAGEGSPRERINHTLSGGNLEQFRDECRLSSDITATNPSNLRFPDHRHHLVTRQRSSDRPETTKAQPQTDQAFDPPVVLFNDVVQVLHLPRLGPLPQLAILLYVPNRRFRCKFAASIVSG